MMDIQITSTFSIEIDNHQYPVFCNVIDSCQRRRANDLDRIITMTYFFDIEAGSNTYILTTKSSGCLDYLWQFLIANVNAFEMTFSTSYITFRSKLEPAEIFKDLNFTSISIPAIDPKRMPQLFDVYRSERGYTLLGTRCDGCDLITLEVSDKWYSPYVIKSDGTVEKVDVTQAPNDIPFLDHNIHPDLLRWVAKSRSDAGVHTEVCDAALELAAGRWVIDVNNQFPEGG